eukprot:XP_025015803.1 uncharacterized protein LOC112537105 [Ricinus communis]
MNNTWLVAVFGVMLSTQAFAVTIDEMRGEQAPYAQAFKALDSDGNGKLSKKEATKDKDIKNAFSRADKNHNGSLDQDEFAAYKSKVDGAENKQAAADSAITAKIKSKYLVEKNLSSFKIMLAELGVQAVDGILLDLGISSPQIDEGVRGFSFRFDGPLDMRMDQSRGKTAAEWLATMSEKQLAEVIRDYGEERFAKQVARAIVKEREDGHAITTTGQLAKIVAGAIPKNEPGQNPATRTFQALRIFVNQELEELSLVLPDCLQLLRPQGRLAVISFHSLEDRIVKRFIQSEVDRDNLPAGLPVRAKDLPQPRLLAVGKAIKPGKAEVAANVRSRSAVLRVAERTQVQ